MAIWSDLPSIRKGAGAGAEWISEFWAPEIFYIASQKLNLIQYCHRVEQFGAGVGESFHIQYFGTLGTRGATLAIGTKVPITDLKTYQVNGTVLPMGNGISLEERALYLSKYDLQNKGARWALGEDLAKLLDGQVRQQILAATTNYVYGGTWGSVGKGAYGTIGTAANFRLTLTAVQRLALAFEEKKVPKLNNEAWVLFVHPRQKDDLFSDAATSGGFIDIHKYSDNAMKKVSEYALGRLFGFDIVSTPFVAGTTESKATGTVQTANAMALGGDDRMPALAWAWAKEPEIVFDPDYQKDFNRYAALAYKCDGACVIVKDEYIGQIQTGVAVTIEENNKLA